MTTKDFKSIIQFDWMSFKYLGFFLNWFVILFCVNDLKMAIYKVYAFCAGQKFDASTISGLIIILYPVAK